MIPLLKRLDSLYNTVRDQDFTVNYVGDGCRADMVYTRDSRAFSGRPPVLMGPLSIKSPML